MKSKLFIALLSVALLFGFIDIASAVSMDVTIGSYNITSIDVPPNGTQIFYTNRSDFTQRVGFSYQGSQLMIIVLSPDVVGQYHIPILLDRIINTGNETHQNYTTETGIFLEMLDLNVKYPEEPKENETEEPDEECEIFISVIGRAFYGKNLLVHTTDDNYKDVIANVVGQDGAGNSLICQTNNPFKGYCNMFIPEDAEPDITLLANKEGCTTGQYIINKLEGQKLTPEEEEEIKQSLKIVGLPERVDLNSMVNGTVLVSETNEIVDNVELSILNPLNAKLTTHTSNGLFRFYAGNDVGDYVIHAKHSDYTQSGNYTVKARVPRKDIAISVLKGNVELDTAYVGDTVDIALYSNGNMVNESVTGKIKESKSSVTVTFEDGWLEYTIQDDGIIKISAEQSENYLAAETSIEAVYPPAWEIFVWPVVIVVIILIIVIVFKKIGRRGGGGGVTMGVPQSTEPLTG